MVLITVVHWLVVVVACVPGVLTAIPSSLAHRRCLNAKQPQRTGPLSYVLRFVLPVQTDPIDREASLVRLPFGEYVCACEKLAEDTGPARTPH